eukprot:scaffold3115_cov20-Tisochrysis_lutea.AAC.1
MFGFSHHGGELTCLNSSLAIFKKFASRNDQSGFIFTTAACTKCGEGYAEFMRAAGLQGQHPIKKVLPLTELKKIY